MARVRLLQPVVFCRTEHDAGAVLEVDDAQAAVWRRNRIAVATAEAMPIWTTCPACGASFPISATPEPGARWVQCRGARCQYGWLR